MTPRRTAATMVAAAVLVNLAFTGLGTAFDYPEVLKHPPAEALADVPRRPGRRLRLVPPARAGRRAARPDRDRRRAPVHPPGHAPRRPRRRRGGDRAGRRPPALAAPGAGLGRRRRRRGVHHRQPRAGQPRRRDVRLPPHRGLDRPRARRARRRGSPDACSSRSAGSRPSSSLWGCFRRWNCRSSTSPTSSATCCGASGC